MSTTTTAPPGQGDTTPGDGGNSAINRVPPVTVDLILGAMHGSTRRAARAPAVGARFTPGQVIAGYRLIRLLGRGGMAVVYEAIHLRLRRPVALKLLVLDDERQELAARFLREARAMMQVRHANLITIHDAGQVEGVHYLAMELSTGGDLAKRIERDGPLPVGYALRLMIGCCEGLAAMHRAGLVHRDIKPGNIFLTADGEAKIGDFGLARQVSGADRMTVTGTSWGTPGYMAPEQIVGAADVDGRADLYALGATFYTLLTGREPFSGETAYLASFKAMTEPFPDPREHNPAVPASVATIIRMATGHERTRRYSSAQAMREDLARAASHARLLHAGSVGVATATVTHPVPVPLTTRRPAAARSPEPRRRGWFGMMSAGVALAGVVWFANGEPSTSAPVFPAWAAAGGHDAAGRWVDLTIDGSTTRLRYRPAGSFRMGSPPDESGRATHETAHQVTLTRGFWMQATECDQAFYRAVTGENPSRHRGAQLPVEQVTWEDAQEFCAILGRHGVPARLPSEAEWEYACRAGSGSAFAAADASELGWMAPLDLAVRWQQGERAARAWCEDRQHDLRLRAHPVGRRSANSAGLFDLHGNVSEWCADRWDGQSAYPAHERTDPLSTTGALVVARGGSWFHPPAAARSAARLAFESDRREDHLGFRFIVPDQPTDTGTP